MWARTKETIKRAKGFYSWYSFGSAVVGKLGLGGLFTTGTALVVGVVASVIQGVPWPITLMAAFSVLFAGACLAATPLIIRVAMPVMQPVPEPNQTRQPVRPHWDAWRHVEKFTVQEAAYLLENLEPSTHSKDPKIQAWIKALSAAIRTGDLAFILNTKELNTYHLHTDWESTLTKQQRQSADWSTEIPKAALMDFAKRNNIDLKYLG